MNIERKIEPAFGLPDLTVPHVFVCTGFETLRAAVMLIDALDPAVPAHLLWFGGDGNDCPYYPEREGAMVKIFPASYGASLRHFRELLAAYPDLAQGRCAAFIPHVAHFAGNYFAQRQRHAWLALLPDGVINYADRVLSPMERLKAVAKVGYGILKGVPYRRLAPGQHITGYASYDYDMVYTFDTRGLLSRGPRISVLPRNGGRILGSGNAAIVVVLDQEISELLESPAEAGLRADLIDYLRMGHFEKIYYKAHPKGVSRHEELLRQVGDHVIALPQGMPIEDVVAELEAGEYLSFYSTGLVALRQMTEARVTAILPAAPSEKVAEFFRGVEDSFRERDIAIHKAG